jgi:hypothetical protein
MLPFSAVVYADGEQSSQGSLDGTYGGKTIEEILSLTSGQSYNVYRDRFSDKAQADAEIAFKAADIIVPNGEKSEISGNEYTTSNYKVDMFTEIRADGTKDTREGVYMPSSGKTTFKVTVPKSGMYAIDLNYFSIS